MRRLPLYLSVLLAICTQRVHAQRPEKGKDHYITIDGAQIFVRIVGQGEPLLILHGGPGMSHDYLAPQFIGELSGDFQLIFFDQRASGRSSGVQDTARLTMNQFVRDIELLRNELKLKQVNLLGHSFGGLLAMYYAVTYPDHVKRLLLIDTSPASWEMNFPFYRKALQERQTKEDQDEMARLKQMENFATSPLLLDKYLKIAFHPYFVKPKLSEQLTLGIDTRWIVNFNITNDRVWNNLGKYDIHDQLTKIKSPTLVLHGDQSIIDPEGAKMIAAKISGATLVILKNVGHFPYVEDPTGFTSAVKSFMKK